MPNKDGRGPRGGGSGRGNRGGGRGMRRNQAGAGAGGFCICPSCGEKTSHVAGIPCSTVTCPKCKVRMMRE